MVPSVAYAEEPIFAALRMRKFLLILLTISVFGACSDFSKALKSTDRNEKFEVARKYFDLAQYERCIPLLEELIVLERGGARAEEVTYMHAKSYFGMKDYILSSFYLANFTRTFPTSKYAEECAFLSAFCYYKNSPVYELDPTDTERAIDELQLFMVRYPRTALRDSCNTLIDILRDKLEIKEFKSGMQYYRTRRYRAAHVSLEEFNRKWPNSEFREEALFSLFKADNELAINSVAEKKEERINDAIRSFHNFADAFPTSEHLPEAERLHGTLVLELERSKRTDTP